MNSRRLGSSGPEVSRVGLGCIGMSGMYGRADRATSVATIGEAELELGEDEVAATERALPPDAVAGEHYPEQQMAILDSERS